MPNGIDEEHTRRIEAMKPDYDGTWYGSVVATGAVSPHHLTLDLNLDGVEPTAELRLFRATPDPVQGRTEFGFRAHVEVCGKFIALLAKDDADLGMNAMVAKVEDGGTALRGIIVFNNVRTNEIEERQIEWRRQLRD